MKDDLVMIQKLIESGRPFVVAMTKADKVPRGRRQNALKALRDSLDGAKLRLLSDKGQEAASAGKDPDSGLPVLFFSATTGEGREALWRWIASSAGVG